MTGQNKYKIFILGFLAFLLSEDILCQEFTPQNVIPPSPDGSALIKQVNIPVDLYTGVPNINVPLFSLPVWGGASSSVALSYHASGIKVNDVSSVVGTGWNLSAGGSITRVVRGKHDFPDTDDRCSEVEMAVNGAVDFCDSAPDIFYFNFPGRSGRFYLNDQAQPFTQPYQNIQITFDKVSFTSDVPNDGQNDETFNNWKITDENGFTYIFGNTSSSKEVSRILTSENGNVPALIQHYESTWHLTSILNSDNQEILSLQYISGNQTETQHKSQVFENVVYDSQDSSVPNSANEKFTNYTQFIKVLPKYLSQITSDYGSVHFTYMDDRLDLTNGKRLDEVSLHDYTGKHIESYVLTQGYFAGLNSRLSDATIWTQSLLDQLSMTIDQAPGSQRRLKLDKIDKHYPNSVMTYRSFIYNMSKGLPGYDSEYVDHYGYYNGTEIGNYNPNLAGASSEKLLPKVNVDVNGDPISTCQQAAYLTSSPQTSACVGSKVKYFNSPGKNSNFEDAKANILEEIHYNSGAYTTLTYETSGYNAAVVRVKEIAQKDLAGITVSSETYTYENEVVFTQPVYHYVYLSSPTGGPDVKTVIVTSNSLTNFLNVNGTPIVYEKVTTNNLDGSYNVKTFYTFADLAPTYKLYSDGSPEGGDVNLINNHEAPFTPKSTRFWEKGLILSEKFYDDTNETHPSLMVEYTYQSNLATPFDQTFALNKHEVSIIDSGRKTKVGKYDYTSSSFFLGSRKQTTIDPKTGNSVSQNTKYTYDANTLQLVQTEVDRIGKDGKYITANKYVTHSDYDNAETAISPTPEVDAIKKMRQRHMIATPVESTTWLKYTNHDTKFLGAVVNKFGVTGTTFTFVKPKSIWNSSSAPLMSSYITSNVDANGNFVHDASLRERRTFDTYDVNNGNLLSSTGTDGITTELSYGYNHTLVTSSITNPGANQLSTSYTYEPLVGVLSETNTNGETTSYEYDERNRLKLIRDDDNNIIERYRYNIKNESESLNAVFQVTGVNQTNSNLSFTADPNTGLFGKTKYEWDFGDGTIVETSSLNINHSFSAEGSYSVTLTTKNPDYASASTSQSVSVFDHLISPAVCVAGPVSRDVCGIQNDVNGTGCGAAPPNSVSTLTVNININGASCGNPYTYQWQRKKDSGNWTNEGTSTTLSMDSSLGIGVYEVRCIVTDDCTMTYTSNTRTITYYKSNPTCGIQ